MVSGSAILSWNKISTVVDPYLGRPGELMCRLDLGYIRQGKDQPPPVVAGRAPDRTGLMFFDRGNDIRAGDRVRCITGPVEGTFEIRAIPDVAQGFSIAHHMEVQIFEVAKTAASDNFPGSGIDSVEYLP
jgi:hypothetical protein